MNDMQFVSSIAVGLGGAATSELHRDRLVTVSDEAFDWLMTEWPAVKTSKMLEATPEDHPLHARISAWRNGPPFTVCRIP